MTDNRIRSKNIAAQLDTARSLVEQLSGDTTRLLTLSTSVKRNLTHAETHEGSNRERFFVDFAEHYLAQLEAEIIEYKSYLALAAWDRVVREDWQHQGCCHNLDALVNWFHCMDSLVGYDANVVGPLSTAYGM